MVELMYVLGFGWCDEVIKIVVVLITAFIDFALIFLVR